MNTTAESIRTLRLIPPKGTRILSINLALVNHDEAWSIAKRLGFAPEVVQLSRHPITEIHLLLWQGKIEDIPADLENKVDALADQINTDAIWYAAGAWTKVA